MNHRKLVCLYVVSVGAIVAAGCSSTPKPQDDAVLTPAPVKTAEPMPEPTVEPTAEPTADAAPASTLPPPSGRTPLIESKPETITGSFGATPAAKLELTKEGAVFRIPEYALNEGLMITFTLDKKGKKAKGGAGSIYRLTAQLPPAEEARTVATRGPMFTLVLPKGTVAAPNLAMGEQKKDDKGKDIVEWTVIAPKSTDDKTATFELGGFTNTFLQITSEAPTAGAAPAASPTP